MELLSGPPVSERIDRAVSVLAKSGIKPRLAVYLIGDDRASEAYVRSKERKGAAIGADVVVRTFPAGSTMEDVGSRLRKDASSRNVHGIIVGRPLPEGFDQTRLSSIIPPQKDVEGMCPENYGLLSLGRPRFVPPTPLGVLLLMLHHKVELPGRNVAVLGRSPNVGRPLSLLLSQKTDWADATVTAVHSGTKDPLPFLRSADIVVSAMGRPGYLKGDMVKEGASLIDVGMSPDPVTGKLVGDVDLASVERTASRATPTPGGTGPVTVSCLFLNLFMARALQEGTFPEIDDQMIRKIYKEPG